MQVIITDGGKSKAGYKVKSGDCVVRAIAIASELPYQQVYEALEGYNRIASLGRSRVAKKLQKRGSSPRNGNFKESYEMYLQSLGFAWVPTMFVGQGCKVHLRSEELPGGRIIASVSKHLVAVIDGVIHDNHDCSRNGTRCVYGYYIKQ